MKLKGLGPGLIVGMSMVLAGTFAPAQETATPSTSNAKEANAASPPAKGASAADVLVVEQSQVADGYARFKNELLKLAEVSRATDPGRAELLEKAIGQMTSSATDDEFRNILKLLESDLLKDQQQAVDTQIQVLGNLNALLKLLLTENRDRRNASEKERLRSYIKEIEQAIKLQKGIQGQTERSGDPRQLAERQGKLAERTHGIAKKIEANEERKDAKDKPDGGDGKDASGKKAPPDDRTPAGGDDNKPDDDKPQDKPGSDGKPSDGQPSDQAPQDGNKSQPGKRGGKPQEPGEGKSPERIEKKEGADQPAAEPQPEEQANGRKQLEQAVERMRQAQKRLDEAKRSDAAKEQEEAVAALEQAKAELEEILRQLREEEVGKMLVLLEARFRNMLRLQQSVLDATVLLDKKPAAERERADEIEAGRLSRREREIIGELDKARMLLREDGSAVAFPEALDQLRDDMTVVAERLDQAKVNPATQRIEQDVIDAVKELIAALEKAQKDLQQRRGMSGQGEPADPPLVDAIAELKMIRALQVRVNRRTVQYAELIRSGESTAAEMLPRLKELAEHEQKIHRISRDLHLGRNE